jgi:hypothetical protein
MDALIILKWLTDYGDHTHDAPSIVSTMIGIPLNMGKIDGRPLIIDADTN